MREETIIAVAVVVLLFLGVVGTFAGYSNGYEQGQIDALSGEIYYHQVPDWQYCEGGCD